MPDKPIWFGRIDQAIHELEALPYPWIGRTELESALGIGRRRAQQILQPLVRHRIGRNGLASRSELVEHLRRLAAGQSADTEMRRRDRFARLLGFLHDQALRPKILVEAPVDIEKQGITDLPPGIELSQGRILVSGFQSPDQAKQLLLALILAMANEPDLFDRLITVRDDL